MKKDDQYWDRAWSLVEGCTPCSPGCERCWSAGIYSRVKPSSGLTVRHPYKTPQYTGRVKFCNDRLDIPTNRKKPTVYAIWTDLFHESLDPADIGWTMSVIIECPQHTFLVLTKRAERMCDLLKKFGAHSNVWLGVTVCNQAEANEKIPLLLQTPAAHRYISVEPMLGPIDLGEFICETWSRGGLTLGTYLDWVICGPETGAGRRPMDEAWARSLYEQCKADNVPFFYKGDLPGLPRELPFEPAVAE